MENIKLTKDSLPEILNMLKDEHKVKRGDNKISIFFNKRFFAVVPFGWYFTKINNITIWHIGCI